MTHNGDPSGSGDWPRFEQLVLPHLDAAYNLARWLTRNDQDAQDVVQDASMRALRYVGGVRGEQARAWWMAIVRHTCFDWLQANRPAEVVPLDDDDAQPELAAPAGDEPQAIAVRNADRAQLTRAIAALPVAYREVLVLRELEDLPYKDSARIADIPVGTVLSRLARARGLLRQALSPATRPMLHAVARPAAGNGAS